MLKKIIGVGLWIGILGVVGGMEQGSIEVSKGFVSCLIMVILCFVFCVDRKKKSAVSGEHNGQAHSVLTKKLQRNYISKKGGVSSGI